MPGTRAEKRTERKVARWFLIAALAGLGFLVAYLFLPFEYAPPGSRATGMLYQLYTPIIGVLCGSDRYSPSASGRSHTRKDLLPHEIAVQERHIGWLRRGRSADHRRDPAPTPAPAASIGRRSMIKGCGRGSAAGFRYRTGGLRAGRSRRNPWKGGDAPRSGSRRGPPTTVSRCSFATTPSSHPGAAGRPGAAGIHGDRLPVQAILVGAAGARCAARIRQPGDADPIAP